MNSETSIPSSHSSENELNVGDWAVYVPKRMNRGLPEEPSTVQIKKIYPGGVARVEVKKTKAIRNIRVSSLQKIDAP